MSMTIYRDGLPVILIDRHIGDDPMYGPGITGADFVRELNKIENSGYHKCEVWINSVGGSVMDGMDIYNAIINSTIEVNTRNVGVAASTAGWILQAGKKRIANYYVQLMMHNTSGGDEKGRNALDESIVSMISVRCSKTEKWVRDRMDETIWLNAEDGMKKHGLYDEIDYKCGVEVKEQFENKSPIAAYNHIRSVVNKLIEEPKKIKMKNLTNLLNLNEDASEDSIMKEVSNLKEQIKTLSDSVKEKEDAIAKIKADKETADKESASVELVENAIKEGRIENDAKEGFVALAKLDLEGVKNTLSKMPVRKIANKLPIDTKEAEGRAGWTYSDWEKKDANGLINMYKNSREQYDLLLNKAKETQNIK
jgi:ATP-dependent protease ClpP protease subunit